MNISYRALLYKIKAAGLGSEQLRADVEAQDRGNHGVKPQRCVTRDQDMSLLWMSV